MDFKRHISIFLALFILLVNSSASLVLHYCDNQIASISLMYQKDNSNASNIEDSCCVSEDKADDKSCCSNEEIKVQKKIDYSILKGFQFDVVAATFHIVTPTFFKDFSGLSIKKHTFDYYCNSNAPPFYKLYSQLVFYA